MRVLKKRLLKRIKGTLFNDAFIIETTPFTFF